MDRKPLIQRKTGISYKTEEKTVWENIWGFVCEIGSAVWDFVKSAVATFLEIIASLLQGLVKLYQNIVFPFIFDKRRKTNKFIWIHEYVNGGYK